MSESGVVLSYRETLQRVMSADFSNVNDQVRDAAAKDVIEMCSLACAGLVLQPIPGLEQAVLPIQIGMVLAIAHIYGHSLNRKRAREIVMDLAAITGVSIIGRQALVTVAKFALPFVGGFLGAPYTFSVTWATGYAAIHYLRSGGRPDADKIRDIFEQERKRSKTHYSESKARENRPEDPDLIG